MDGLFEVPTQTAELMTFVCNFRRCTKAITATADQARAAGWIIWQGTDRAGRFACAEFCPRCAHRGVSRRRASRTGARTLDLPELPVEAAACA